MIDFGSKLREYRDLHRKSRYELKKYLLKDGKVHPVAVICPGGGYEVVCSFGEGHPFAKKLNQMGYHAFVVYYRVGEEARYPAPQEDLARAIRTIHDHAEKWKLDMKNYSVWGSSAGGHLVGSFGTENMGYPNYDLPKPGTLVLSYPVVTMGEKTHMGSRNHLLGKDAAQKQIDFASIEKQITSAYPPTFVWWGDADSCVPPDNSRMLLKALEAQNIPCRGIEYPGVEHGASLGIGTPCEGWLEKAVEFWEEHR